MLLEASKKELAPNMSLGGRNASTDKIVFKTKLWAN